MQDRSFHSGGLPGTLPMSPLPNGSSPAILIASPFSPLRVGGVGQFLIDVGVDLVSNGFHLRYLHSKEPDAIALPPDLRAVPRMEIQTNGPRGMQTVLIVLRTLRRMISSRDAFAVCHILVPRPLTATALALSRLFGRRAVATVFAPYPSDPNPGGELAQRIAERLTLAMADEVVYECEATRRHFSRRGLVIYNGVDSSFYRPDEERRREVRSRLGIPPEATVFLYAGRITELKGIRDLVDAFLSLDRSLLEQGYLLLVGPVETSDLGKLLPSAEFHGLRVRVLPPVGRSEIRDFYQASDVFVLPSYLEGISSALQEAMACGLPAIVSNVGGNPEVVLDGRTGLLHVAGDVEGLRARLAEMIAHPERRRFMGREARARMETVFGLRTMARRYREVYERISREKPSINFPH